MKVITQSSELIAVSGGYWSDDYQGEVDTDKRGKVVQRLGEAVAASAIWGAIVTAFESLTGPRTGPAVTGQIDYPPGTYERNAAGVERYNENYSNEGRNSSNGQTGNTTGVSSYDENMQEF
jgi:hypothetical protein